MFRGLSKSPMVGPRNNLPHTTLSNVWISTFLGKVIVEKRHSLLREKTRYAVWNPSCNLFTRIMIAPPLLSSKLGFISQASSLQPELSVGRDFCSLRQMMIVLGGRAPSIKRCESPDNQNNKCRKVQIIGSPNKRKFRGNFFF